MEAFITSIGSILSIVLLIALGYVLKEKQWFSDSFSGNISKLIMNIALPASIFVSVLKYLTLKSLLSLTGALVYTFLSVIIGYIFAYILVKIINVPVGRKGTFINTVVNANTIFIGLPLNIALFGNESLPYFLVYYVTNTVSTWAFGAILIGNDTNDKNKQGTTFDWKKLFPPPLLGFIVALVFLFLSIPVPAFVNSTLGYLGGIVTPLSLIYIGIVLHNAGLKSIKFESGDFVKKGQVIAIIDDTDYKVNLDAFSKKYEAAKAVAQNAEQQFARAETLYRGDALAKKDYDNALMQRNVAISTFKEASAGLQNARNTLNDTKIVAPYDGYIDKKVVDVGTVVPEGGPVVSFISNEITDISVNASVRDIEYIKNAENISFKDSTSDKIYSLKIKSIAQNPDSINLTYPVVFTFSELSENDKFLSGQTGTVTIAVKNKEKEEILIPINAIFEDKGSNVYLFKDGKAVKTPIELGELRETDKISVVKGLKTGDKVIVAGVSKLADGDKVKLLGGNK